jgi:hypothetical protein
MAKTKYRGVTSYRDRVGKTRYRLRLTGIPTHHFRSEFGSEEFETELSQAMATKTPSKRSIKARLMRARREARARGLNPLANDCGRNLVYVIGATKGPVKIGRTNDISSRLIRLQVGHPEKLRVLAKFDGGAELEAALHARFSGSRLRGEWYKRTTELREFLANLGNGDLATLFEMAK